MTQKAIPEGIRITKVGLWYVLITLVIAVAATNSGNNALYMIWALMLAILIVSGLISRQNVRKLTVRLEIPDELYANQPFPVRFELRNNSRLFPRWLLLFAVAKQGQPWLIPHLPRQGVGKGEVEMLLPRRGRQRIGAVHLASLFPYGLFRKGARYKIDQELLVFPELFPASQTGERERGDHGEEPIRRPGWGHELHALRELRAGDDPRGIHWKRSARMGRMIYMEREAEESRRLSILFDNGVGDLDEDGEERFERLVSEAATAAVEHLRQGFEVELITRETRLGFAAGVRQKVRVLEALALVEARPRDRGQLRPSNPRVPQIRLGMAPEALEAVG